MSYIISRKRDKTENVNDNILLFEVGQKVRLLNNKNYLIKCKVNMMIKFIQLLKLIKIH
jgi:hypothetical protein